MKIIICSCCGKVISGTLKGNTGTKYEICKKCKEKLDKEK